VRNDGLGEALLEYPEMLRVNMKRSGRMSVVVWKGFNGKGMDC
jgi:hypothetical protein